MIKTTDIKKALEHFITAFGHYNGIEKNEGNEQALQQLRLGIEILEGAKSGMVFVPGKSEAYNAGWESFFIDRDLSDNPHSAGSESHNDWSDGFHAAQASTNN